MINLPVVDNLDAKSEHGDDEADQGANEDATEGAEGDAVAVVEGGALGPQGGLPVPGVRAGDRWRPHLLYRVSK